MARMKVVLKERVDNLGDVGDVVQVAGGYARNFLIPRGLAVPATKGNIRHAEHWRHSIASRDEKEVTEAREVARTLESAPLQVAHQAGPDGRLFGSITQAEIAHHIAEAHGVEVDRHDIELPEPIRHLGYHEVRVKLHAEVTANVTVEAIEVTPA